MNIDQFTVASKAAEDSLGFISTAETRAANGDQTGAVLCLNAVKAVALVYTTPIREADPELAAIAEGQVSRHGPNGPIYYSSIHEAVTALWAVLIALYSQNKIVPADLCDSLGVNISQLRVGLVRERAKLLSQAQQPNGKPDKDRPASGDSPSLDARALAVFIENPAWSKKRIAEHLNCHEKSLAPSRCPKLRSTARSQRTRRWRLPIASSWTAWLLRR